MFLFFFIPSHKEIDGNERADNWAKVDTDK